MNKSRVVSRHDVRFTVPQGATGVRARIEVPLSGGNAPVAAQQSAGPKTKQRDGRKVAPPAQRLFAAIADKSRSPQERADHAAALAGLGPKANQPLILPLGRLARGEADAKVQSWLAAAINEGGYARVGNCRQQAVRQLRQVAGFAADDSVWNLATQYRVALRKLEP